MPRSHHVACYFPHGLKNLSTRSAVRQVDRGPKRATFSVLGIALNHFFDLKVGRGTSFMYSVFVTKQRRRKQGRGRRTGRLLALNAAVAGRKEEHRDVVEECTA